MRGFKFKDEGALKAALLSEIVPEKVAESSVSFCREGKAIWVVPETLPKAVGTALEKAGAPLTDLPVEPLAKASCWAETLSPERGAEPDTITGPVLFQLGSEQTLLDVAAELLRLGCVKQSFATVSESEVYIRAVAPPYYTLVKAYDKAGNTRAFRPAAPGQENVWIEVGLEHDLATKLKPNPKDLVLIGPEPPWRVFQEPQWQDIRRLIRFVVPDASDAGPAPVLEGQVDVMLKLAPGGPRSGPALWVLRDKPEEQVEKLVTALPQEIIQGLLFVAAEVEGEKIVVLRARPSLTGAPPVMIEVQGESYAQHPQFRNLFLPEGARIEPPLRRDRIRDLLAPNASHVVWLRRQDDSGEFRPETVKEAEFEPLEKWVNYIVAKGSRELQAWERSTIFQMETYDLGEAKLGKAREDREPRKEKRPRETQKAPDDKEGDRPPVKAPQTPKRTLKHHEPIAPPKPEDKSEQAAWIARQRAELANAQQAYLELPDDLHGDASERTELWVRIGNAHASLGQLEQASLCWSRAMWHMGSDSAARVAAQWLDAELIPRRGRKKPDNELVQQALDARHPSDGDVRIAVSYIISARSATNGHGAQLQRWLDSHEEDAEMRGLWLAQVGLSKLSGDDGLGLARLRDHLLGRLHGGLMPDESLPSFLRSAEVSLVAREQKKATVQVDELYKRVIEAKRKASPTEADGKLTWAYLRMGVAYGMARLGLPDRARKLIESAKQKLTMSDPVHAALVAAYSERVEQALVGQSLDAPFSAATEKMLADLSPFMRYKVDRLRQASEVLVSQESLDPMRAFMRKIRDSRGEEFEGLRGMSDRAKLAEEIEGICGLASSPKTALDERVRLYDGAMDYFPKLNESQVLPHLKTIPEVTEGVPGVQRAPLFEKALTLSGHFGEMDLVESYVERLKPVLASLSPKEASEGTLRLDSVMRMLRRLGLNEEASDLLAVLEEAAEGAGPEMLRYQLQLATARSTLGDHEHATKWHEMAFKELGRLKDSRDRGVSERLKLCRGLTRSLGALPEDARIQGLRRLETQQLETMTDRFNTNSHFCLAVVAFVEYLVFAYVGEGPGISTRMRQMLDEEEYLLRRRIHRDTMEISR